MDLTVILPAIFAIFMFALMLTMFWETHQRNVAIKSKKRRLLTKSVLRRLVKNKFSFSVVTNTTIDHGLAYKATKQTKKLVKNA